MKKGELFQRAFEDAAIGMSLVSVNPFGQYIEVNPAFCEMTGYSREELLERDFQSITSSQDLAGNINQVQPLIKGIIPAIRLEKRYIRKDGSSFWARLYVSSVRSGKRKPTHLIVQIEDIDTQKQAERDFESSQQKLSLHIRQTPLGVIEWNTDFEVIDWNPSAEKIFGFSRDEAIGRHAVGLLVPESAKDHVNQVWEALLVNKGGLRSTNENMTKTGKIILCEWYNTPLVNELGQVIGVASLVQDITEVTKAGEKIQRQAAVLHELHAINTLPDLDEQRLCDEIAGAMASYFNAPFAKVEKLTNSELEVLSMWERGTLTHGMRMPLRGTPCENVRDIRSRCQIQGNLQAQFPDIPFFANNPVQSFAGAPFFDHYGNVLGVVNLMYETPEKFSEAELQILQLFGQVVGAFLERKTLEEQLRHAQKLEAIGQLAGGVAHEFNNILTAIIGHLDQALNETSGDPTLHSTLSECDRAAHRAAALTHQLLAFGRRSAVDLKPQNLRVVADEVTRLLRQTIDRRISVTLESAEGLWPILGDAAQMHQVVMNLCVNARDTLLEKLSLMETQGTADEWAPQIHIRAENIKKEEIRSRSLSDLEIGGYVCLSVYDNGCGIDPAHQDRVFEPFFTTKSVGQGTGLGLATVYGIVSQHNGFTELVSRKDESTTLKVYLPRTEVSEPVKVTPAEKESATEGQETILVIDDESSIRRLIQAILEKHGYTVLLAKDGAEALDVYSRNQDRIQLVILDLTLPHRSGWEVLHSIHQSSPNLKVIISSGHRTSQGPKKDIDLENVAFLPKPYRPEDLAREVRRVLDQSIQKKKNRPQDH